MCVCERGVFYAVCQLHRAMALFKKEKRIRRRFLHNVGGQYNCPSIGIKKERVCRDLKNEPYRASLM